MDIATGNWFGYLNEEIFVEGVRDIGLPEYIVDYIENGMAQSPEKSKTYVGNEWKKYELSQAYRTRLQVELVDHLVKQYGDYVMMAASGGEGQPLEVGARTVTPFSTNDPDRQRQEYDDEMKKRAEQVKFVILNLKNVLAKPAGAWRKAFMKAVKALSKIGIPSEKVEFTKEYLQSVMKEEFRTFWNKYDLLFSWLNDEPTNYELIKGESNINTAYDTAREELESRQDPENIMHEFEDGSYWYNLNTSNCSVEGERMGHCGSDSRGVLVSLRKRQGKRKAPTSYVTMTWADESYDGNTIYQIKGRSNDAPPMETWDHIDWFIKNMGVELVQETGEHSRDAEGIQEMIDYLQTQNRGVSFNGVIDEGAIQEAIDEVVNDYEGENSSISGEVYGPEEHGGDGVYVYMNGYGNLQINLGWKGFEERNNEFTPTLGPDDTTEDERFRAIPGNNWGGDAREFLSDTEIENIAWDMPGEDADIEWDVKMLTGAIPGWEIGDPEPAPTAHLEIEIRTTDQEGVEDDDDAGRVASNFASNFISAFEDDYEEIVEKVRTKLAEEGYSAKTAYDQEREGMTETTLENWKVYQDGPKLEFWFRRGKNDPGGLLNSGGDLTSFSEEVMMWGHSPTGQGGLDALYRKTFGSDEQNYRIENDDLNRNMARNLEKLYAAEGAPDPAQAQLPFGADYEAPPASLVLAKDSHFIIKPSTTRRNNRYPTMLLNWKYEIAVDSKSSPEEIEVVKDIVKYFNENPDMVEEAAAQTIRNAVQGVVALARATKEDVLSGKWPQHAIRSIDSQFGARAMAGDDTNAEQIILTTKWIKDNFDQMGEPEMYVAWFYYLKPMKEGYYQPYSNPIYIGGENEPGEAGQPQHWNEKVRAQMDKMGAHSHTARGYAVNEDASVGESVEQQIDRVERPWKTTDERDTLIDEVLGLIKERDPGYDLRIYQILIKCSMSKDRGGQRGETETEIRGIDGVTVVSGVTYREDLQNWYSTLRIKFELLGRHSREDYVKLVLLPSLLKIRGLKIVPGGMGNVKKISRDINEVVNAGTPRQGPVVPTPRPSIADLIDAWVGSNERVYDVPSHNAATPYHTMVDIDELWGCITSPFYRNTTRELESVKKNIINHGIYNPIVVAIGKNGRAKITSGIDLVFAAKDIGMRELPTIFMYQKQV
tara:strand:+ start:34542 stop:38027 length:3486 start_codon:yes stop_codon:yes gene_type:complete